jgi:hypothetical protein
MSSNIAKPPPLFPYDYGWRKDAAEPLPAFFEGIIMTSDFLQDLICSWLQALLLAYSSSRDTKQISSSSHTNL